MNKPDLEIALNGLIELCKNDVQKSLTSDGVDLIVNDYHIRAQRILFELDQMRGPKGKRWPVEYLLKKVKSAADAAKQGKPESLKTQ